MATRKATTGLAGEPIDFIDDKLREVRATLDLIFTGLGGDEDSQQNFLALLDPETLAKAVHASIERIDETREALSRLPVKHFVTDQVDGEVRQ